MKKIINLLKKLWGVDEILDDTKPVVKGATSIRQKTDVTNLKDGRGVSSVRPINSDGRNGTSNKTKSQSVTSGLPRSKEVRSSGLQNRNSASPRQSFQEAGHTNSQSGLASNRPPLKIEQQVSKSADRPDIIADQENIEKDLSDFPEADASIKDWIIIDQNNRIIHYVDTSIGKNAIFLTWRRRVLVFDDRYRFEPSTYEDLNDLINQGLTSDVQVEEEMFSGSKREKVYDLMKFAVQKGCTDMHMITRENFTEIQYRHKDDIKSIDKISVADGHAYIRILFQSFDGSKPASINYHDNQDAQISGPEIARLGLASIRLNRGPCFPGEGGAEYCSVRFMPADSSKPIPKLAVDFKSNIKMSVVKVINQPVDLIRTGLDERQQTDLFRAVSAPSGIILVTGPTGSGKTTLINNMLRYANYRYPTKRQVTAEDPTELPMPWAVQLEIKNTTNDKETGDGFAKAMRTMLRMDPNIIFLGELRAAPSATKAIEAAQTGHLVLSTLHVSDPFNAIDRLEQMDRHNLHRSITCDHTIIRCIVGQRLLKLLCPHCKIPMVENIREVEPWIAEAVSTYTSFENVFLRGKGCKHCDFDGIKGITAVAEVIRTDDELMQVYRDKGTIAARNFHRLERPKSDRAMVYHAMTHVIRGNADPRFVAESIDEIPMNEFTEDRELFS